MKYLPIALLCLLCGCATSQPHTPEERQLLENFATGVAVEGVVLSYAAYNQTDIEVDSSFVLTKVALLAGFWLLGEVCPETRKYTYCTLPYITYGAIGLSLYEIGDN